MAELLLGAALLAIGAFSALDSQKTDPPTNRYAPYTNHPPRSISPLLPDPPPSTPEPPIEPTPTPEVWSTDGFLPVDPNTYLGDESLKPPL